MKAEDITSAIAQQYMMAEHWASDLEFFKIETLFLRGLLENHFIALCDDQYIGELKRLGEQLLDLDKDEYECEQLITLQLIKLGLVAKYASLGSKEDLKESQVEVETTVMTITKEYREIKGEVFKLVEKVMKANKLTKMTQGHI